MYGETPIIKLSVEHMRFTMATALHEYAGQLDADLQAALTAFCTPDNLQRIIESETYAVLDRVIREEVRNWYVAGDGRKVIKAAVAKRLSENSTFTPLDET